PPAEPQGPLCASLGISEFLINLSEYSINTYLCKFICLTLQSPGDVHMVEADVLLRAGSGVPILAHPPDTDSDITLQEWLAEMASTNKGIKLDFKSLDAVGPSLELLGQLGQHLDRPVWLNGDILPGPHASHAPLDARTFLATVTSSCPEATLSLGWTTAGVGLWEPCYEWPMVQDMSRLCRSLSQPVTFPVRAALVPGSIPQLQWLLQQSQRYSLTVWTGKEDLYSVEDLLFIRENFDKSRVYYDIFEPQNTEFKKAIGIDR
uniref:Family with sequence similarity 151 member B n=1 Tax=Malurus cyaneus samueli TaxID=2593467 RepID=A0A8C5TN76_9PASS